MFMIKRTILKEIELSVKSRPITLITGARQVGKSTLAQLFMKDGFSYVSLDNSRERELARKDPSMFLELHPWPLIIDEVQRAPELFEALEEKAKSSAINSNLEKINDINELLFKELELVESEFKDSGYEKNTSVLTKRLEKRVSGVDILKCVQYK